MKVGAFELNEPVPKLNKPHALATIRPLIDVGNVGTLTLSRLESYLDSHDLGMLQRPGGFFDFTRYRPQIFLKEDHSELHVPNATVSYGEREEDHDFLFLNLLEPHTLAEEYIESILKLLTAFDVKRYCLIGAMHDMVPHTRPLIVSGRASNLRLQSEMEAVGVMSSDYQGPTTILHKLSQQAVDMGVETLSLIVHLPQYLIMEEDFRGVVRLMEILGTLYEFPLSEADADKAKDQTDQVNKMAERLIQMEPRYRHIRSQLEAHYDARVSQRGGEPKLSPEVEKFLQDLGRRFDQN